MNTPSLENRQLRELIHAGIQAPSPDNMQPWRFKLLEDGFELYFDRKYMGHFFDDREYASLMGCGALLENAAITAAHQGLKLKLDETGEDSDIIVRARFVRKDNVKPDIPAETVFLRCTNRRLFSRSKSVPADCIDQLNAMMAGIEQFQLHWYDDGARRREAISIVTEADTIRFSHEQIHDDFHQVLRFGSAAEALKDGLAQKTLGIEPFFIPVLKRLRPWKLTRMLNRIGLHRIMALRGMRLPMMSAPHIVAMIKSGQPDPLLSGRIMQRFWLKLAELGIDCQPLGAFPLFMARLRQSAGDGFSAAQIELLKRLEARLMAISPDYRPDDQLVMMFRLGYSRRAPNRAHRRPIESFIIP